MNEQQKWFKYVNFTTLDHVGENDHRKTEALPRMIVGHHMNVNSWSESSFQPLDVVDVAFKNPESKRTGAVNVCGNAITFDKLLDIADSISGSKSSKFFR